MRNIRNWQKCSKFNTLYLPELTFSFTVRFARFNRVLRHVHIRKVNERSLMYIKVDLDNALHLEVLSTSGCLY